MIIIYIDLLRLATASLLQINLSFCYKFYVIFHLILLQ